MLENELRAKVRAVNRANELANVLQQHVLPIFAGLVGKTIAKNDQTLLAKVEKLLPNLPRQPSVSVFVCVRAYSLSLIVRTCENDGQGHVIYHETTLPIGNIRDKVLVSIEGLREYKSNFSVEDVQAKQREVKKLQEAYENSRDLTIALFGEI